MRLATHNSAADTFSPCLVIPHYEHINGIAAVLGRMQQTRSQTASVPNDWPCFIVDDGSSVATQEKLQSLVTKFDWVRLIVLSENGGKGTATLRGFREAFAAGFTHALQIDADGQHTIEDIPKFFAAAAAAPDRIIAGKPVYDDSIPKARLYGRYLTRFWVWVNTLSFAIVDPQCGYRLYPLASVMPVIDRNRIARRMDFDIDIVVRLYWAGIPVDNLPTRVTYPETGVSHFDMLKDNARISRCHTVLFFGMLWRLPTLLWRKIKTRSLAGTGYDQ